MKSSTLLLVVLSILFCCTMATAQEDSEKNVSFIWAMGALVQTDGQMKLTNIKKDTSLTEGDQLKMLVQLNSKSYVYVLYMDTKGEITLLFPNQLTDYHGNIQTGKRYFIPEGTYWFTLDNETGKEKIYLLASVSPLSNIEKILTQYQLAEGSEKSALRTDLLAEIKNLRRKYRQNIRASAERPALIGGLFRSLGKPKIENQDISQFAAEISAVDFFGRTFTIDHQ